MSARGRKSVLAVLPVLALACGALAAVPGGATACIILCPKTTSTTTTSTSISPTAAPSLSDVVVSVTSSTSARASATIDPGGLSTGWSIAVTPTNSEFGLATTQYQGELAAGFTGVPVTGNVSGLEPNVTYTLSVSADNEAGSTTSPALSFTTPLEPSVPIALTVKRSVLEIHDNPGVTATVGRELFDPVDLDFKAQGTHRYRFAAYWPLSPPDRSVKFIWTPEQNGRIRAVLGGGLRHPEREPSTSNSIRLLVFPRPELILQRDPSDSRHVSVDFSYVVHPLRRGFVGELAYLYRSSNRSGPFTRFAVRRLRHENTIYGPALGTRVRIEAVGPIAVFGCIRHQLLHDMGIPFTYRRCGGPTLK